MVSTSTRRTARTTPYQYGDAWYRDMREPGFDGEVAPDADNSLQWLAERIVTDDRFAVATVKFWWPAILGIEVAEPPEDRNDSNFEAMLLASNAQSTEVERLAEAFRTGIAGGKPYNLKDLLVEIVLSPWFRTESIEGRRSGSRGGRSGTLAANDYSRQKNCLGRPKRSLGTVGAEAFQSGGSGRKDVSLLNDPDSEYNLTYGGIDSDAVTERADDMTAVMAAVAQSHAVETSCPVVRRELLLLPDEKRHLFGGIDEHVNPVSDKIVSFEITAEDWRAPQTVSFQTALNPGSRTIRLAFINDYWAGDDDNRNLFLDWMEIRGSSGNIVTKVEFESIRRVQRCGDHRTDQYSGNSYQFWNNCSLEIPVEFPVSDDYTIEVGAFQDRGGDKPAMLVVSVESDIETSQGAKAIRNKLVELHETLLGVAVTIDSPDVEAAFQLFVEVWNREQELKIRDEESDCGEEGCWLDCPITDLLYFDGIADDIMYINERGDLDFNWDRINELKHEVDWYRIRPEVRAWVAVLAYLLMDYRYLYL